MKRGIVEIFCNAVTFVDKAYQNQDQKQYANVKDNDQDDQQLVKNYIMRPFQIASFYQYYMSLGCLSQKEISQQMPAYQLGFNYAARDFSLGNSGFALRLAFVIAALICSALSLASQS